MKIVYGCALGFLVLAVFLVLYGDTLEAVTFFICTILFGVYCRVAGFLTTTRNLDDDFFEEQRKRSRDQYIADLMYKTHRERLE